MPSRSKTIRLRLLAECPAPWCPYCRCWLDDKTATVDHKTPRIRGGTNAPDNLQLCCQECNRDKGRMTDWEFRAAISGIVSKVPTFDDVIREAYADWKKPQKGGFFLLGFRAILKAGKDKAK